MEKLLEQAVDLDDFDDLLKNVRDDDPRRFDNLRFNQRATVLVSACGYDVVKISNVALCDVCSFGGVQTNDKGEVIDKDFMFNSCVDVLANFRKLDGTIPSTIQVKRNGKITSIPTPDYYNCCGMSSLYEMGVPAECNLVVDAYMCSTPIRRDLARNIYT